MGLQGCVRQLKDLPQVWRYLAQFECRGINKFVHVLEPNGVIDVLSGFDGEESSISCFSKAKTTIGVIASCTCARISGELSAAEMTVPIVCAIFIAAISLLSLPSNSNGVLTSGSEVSPLFEATSAAKH